MKEHTHELVVKAVDKLSATRVKLLLEYDSHTVHEHEAHAAQKFARNVRVPGFRPGKAPIKMIFDKYREEIRKEVLNHLLQAGIREALETTQLDPVSVPQVSLKQVSFDNGKPMQFEAEFDVRPQIDLKHHKGASLKAPDVEVKEEEVLKTVENLRERLASLEPTTLEKGEKGGFAVVEITIEVPDFPKKNQAKKSYTLEMGAGKILTDLDNALLDMKVGEERRVSLQFPADYDDTEVAGKNAFFDCKLLEIKKKVVPVADDAMAAQLRDGLTLESLKTDIRRDLQGVKDQERRKALRGSMMEHLIQKHSFEVPESMIEEQAKRILAWMEEDIKKRGQTPAVWKEDELKQVRERAERQVRGSLLLREVAVQENITLSEEALNQKIESVAAQMNQSVDETRKWLAGKGMMEQLKDEALTDQIFDFLLSQARIENQ